MQYVFVDISFETQHLVETVRHNFGSDQRLAIVGTIQYASSFHRARQALLETHPHVFIPQANPLTGGELLGCTSPTLPPDTSAIIYVADGRCAGDLFCVAAAPLLNARQVPPGVHHDCQSHGACVSVRREQQALHSGALPGWGCVLEVVALNGRVQHDAMMSAREQSVAAARAARTVGVVLGTLGRQGALHALRVRRLNTLQGATRYSIDCAQTLASRAAWW